MHNPPRVRVGVVGASGYGGAELVRLLTRHPHVDICYIAGSQDSQAQLVELYPHLSGQVLPVMEAFHADACALACDTVFVALPSGVSGFVAGTLWERGLIVLDLSGDLRLPADLYSTWYRHQPVDSSIQSQAVYGLTEWYRDDIAAATLVSNPGCYATAVLLGLLPLVRHRLWAERAPLIVDAKSGVSGAGKTPTRATHAAELSENFYAYKVGCHQHVPEIEQVLGADAASKLVMTTQVLPAIRGIFAACYVTLSAGRGWADVQRAFEQCYGDAPFIHLTERGHLPELKHVRGSNQCRIGFHMDERTGVLHVFSVIDNLQKGAAGQAIQNFNVIHGFSETAGLEAIPLYP